MPDTRELRCLCQPDMTIDPRSAVPPAVRQIRVIDAHLDYVRTIKSQMRREVVLKTDVPVRTMSEMLAVDPDVAVVIDAVELDRDRAIEIAEIERERFAIPTDTARRETVRSAAWG